MSAVNLTQEQRAAAEDSAPRVALVAPPGSGKTATLAARVREIRNPRSSVPGTRAVAITFTEKAAAELRERTDGAAECRTFHGFARHLCGLVGAAPTVYDQVDSDDVACLVGEELGLLQAGRYKDRRKAAEKVLADPAARRRYVATLRKARAVDYDLLVADGLRAAQTPGVADSFAATQFLVDEAQDTSPDLWDLVDALRPSALFVVGDPRQQIYGWRGGSAARLLGAYAAGRAGGWSAHALTANFRSVPAVVGAGNRLARPMPFQAPEMVATRPDSVASVTALTCGSSTLEAQEVAAWVAGQLDSWTAGAPAAFVLGRSWRSLDKVADALEAAGVSFVHLGRRADVWTTEHGRAVLRGLSLMVNPWQDHWTRWLAPRLGTPMAALLEAAEAAARSDRAILEVLAETTAEWSHWRPRPSLALANPVEEADRIGRLLRVDALEREEIVGQVKAWAEAGGSPGGSASVDAFLEWIATRHTADAAPEAAVWLSTVHGVKGLEAPAVAVVGMDHAGFGERSEEERRLAFVGATRARDRLLVTYSTSRGDPSPFWSEIGGAP